MYRIAVIQNENETIRSGYANVIEKLSRIPLLTSYSMELFNVVNIDKFFKEGDLNIKNYDSIVITTNATSDKYILDKLRLNKKDIELFLSSGKGIFISSQKKLSSANINENEDYGKTLFLPDIYEYYTAQRPKEEKDSGEGNITVNAAKSVLLNYPQNVTIQETVEHCKNNEFKKHYYRSVIKPLTKGVYESVFIDNSYSEMPDRCLLATNIFPQYGERIVISTIAIDWESHVNLLTNIIVYITEGQPKVAFVGQPINKVSDFDYLLSSAKLSKIAYKSYDSITNIDSTLLDIHNTYIFSPNYQKNEIEQFIGTINAQRECYKKKYVRIYYFEHVGESLALVQYSNFSTIDILLDNAILWIVSKYSGKMWNNSFWTSYDILIMMNETGVNPEAYIETILRDIKKHYIDYSYDGVVGATCGLLEILLIWQTKYPQILIETGIQLSDLQQTIDWLLRKYPTQSYYDRQTIISTIYKYYGIIGSLNLCIDENEWNNLKANLNIADNIDFANITELDICRLIELHIIQDTVDSIQPYIIELKKKQNIGGKWVNIRRSATILVFLLSNIDKIPSSEILDEMIYNGILYLRSSYKWKLSNWDNDIQATAKALHAIGLYNSIFHYSTQDFFKTLEVESDKVYAASVVLNVSESIRNLRYETNETSRKLRLLSQENIDARNTIFYQDNSIKELNSKIKRIHRIIMTTRTFAVITGSLFFAILLYLGFKYPERALQEIRQIDIVGIIGGFVVGLIFTSLINRNIDKN